MSLGETITKNKSRTIADQRRKTKYQILKTDKGKTGKAILG